MRCSTVGPVTVWKAVRLALAVIAVLGLRANLSAQTIGLSWNAASGATGYIVAYGTQSGQYSQSVDAGSQTSVSVGNLTVGQRYYFAVQAYNAAGSSGFSNEVSGIVQALAPSAPPPPPPSPAPPVSSVPPREGLNLDGNNRADVFAFNPANGAWSIQTSTGTGQFSNGPAGGWAAGWQIHPADFDGNGLTDFLLYNPTNGVFYRAIKNAAGSVSGPFRYYTGGWAAGWTIKILDLNGDGLSDVFLYNQATGVWYRCISSAVISNGFSYSGGGWAAGWDLYVAKFDGDSRDDLFLYSRLTGTWYKAHSGTGATFTYVGGGWITGWQLTVADFDGDGRSDVFLYNPVRGVWFRAIGTPAGFSYTNGAWAAGWTLSAADWNGDRVSDLLLYNRQSGVFSKALNNGGSGFTHITGGWTRWSTWVTDLNGDGNSDVLLYDSGSGRYYQALSTPTGFSYHNGTWASGLLMIVSR